jgi:hypothetical protein
MSLHDHEVAARVDRGAGLVARPDLPGDEAAATVRPLDGRIHRVAVEQLEDRGHAGRSVERCVVEERHEEVHPDACAGTRERHGRRGVGHDGLRAEAGGGDHAEPTLRATAAASAGVVMPPIAACWIGSRHRHELGEEVEGSRRTHPTSLARRWPRGVGGGQGVRADLAHGGGEGGGQSTSS